MQTIREQETQHILVMQKKIETLRNALNDLLFGYQQLMETGFHRIRDLGGTCDPFEVHRVDDFMTYPPNTFRVNPKTSAKFPAIVRFVSMDTFDRSGSIKGQDLTIISLKALEDGQMMFV